MFVLRTSQDHRIVAVNDAWINFARVNWHPDLGPEPFLGRQLLEFINHSETRDLFSLLLERLAINPRPLKYQFRCDSPHRLRLMEMLVEPLPGRGINWRSRALVEKAREPLALWDPSQPRDHRFLHSCGWCKKIQVPDWLGRLPAGLVAGRYHELEEVMNLLWLDDDTLPEVSHGICPECLCRVEAEWSGL